jgi:hypothetical protein
MTPDRVHVIGMELEHKFMVPGPAAGVMSERLQPFLRGMRLAELADGTRDVRQFCDATSLDLMMGTLVVLTLLDGRLIRLEDTPLPPPSIPDLHLELIDEGAMPTPTSDAAQA